VTRAVPTAPAEAGDGSAPDPASEFKLRRALEEMVRRGASDLHLKVGRPPVLRIMGALTELDQPLLKPEEARRCAEQILTPPLREQFAAQREIDFAIGVQGLGRFRVNLFQQRGTLSFAFRAIPFEIPSLSDLQLPPILYELAGSARGLILVTGVTGSGKSARIPTRSTRRYGMFCVRIPTSSWWARFVTRYPWIPR
jgi:twitching motility protein PilT